MNVRRTAGCLLAILAALTVQIALSRGFPALSERLDLLLLVVVYYGLTGAQITSMLAGAAAGLLQDVWFGSLLGRNGFKKVLTGYLVGVFGTRLSLEAPLTQAAVLALATLADHVTGVLVAEILGLPLADPFPRMVAERAIVNALFGTACYAAVRRMSRAHESRLAGRSRRLARSLKAAR